MKKILLIFGFSILTLTYTKSQSVDIDKGCVPLEVQFSAPTQTNYFWDFGDNDTSDKQNPQHAYVEPGEYEAVLFDMQNGTRIGSVSINVYEDIIIEIVPDIAGGCSPLDVNFSADIIKDPEIEIVSYLWSFGDGNSSNQASPTHQYRDEGLFTVSVEITTNIGECDKTVRKEELITIEELTAFFKSDNYTSCDFPSSFLFENLSDQEPNYIYSWDFGNGQTSNLFNPDSITYDDPGLYQIILTVDNGSVCIKEYIREVNVGSQSGSDFEAPDQACIGDTIILTSNEIATNYQWQTIGNATTISVNRDTFIISPNDFGDIEVRLTTSNIGGCNSLTIDTITIDPNTDFNVSPEGACAGEVPITLTATNQTYQSYIWNDSIIGGPEIELTIEIPPRDSFYINLEETFSQSLTVITDIGCVSTQQRDFTSTPPEAYFIPDKVMGCAPLSITFTDHSTSNEEITHSGWDYNDGSYEELLGDTVHTHIFENAGKYFVKLDIANSVGCIDTSKGVWITVIDCIDVDSIMIGGGSGLPLFDEIIEVCVGTDVEVTSPFDSDSELQLHIDSDAGRFDFCWENDTDIHKLEHPGTFPILATLENEGFIRDSIELGTFQVNGSRSEFSYSYNCEDIKTFTFVNESINADRLRWFINDSLASTEQKFSHTFTDFGEHEVLLSTQNLSSGCLPHFNSVKINIEETIANFSIPDTICANETLLLDASNSTVYEECCKAQYTWILEGKRNRCVNRDSVFQFLNPGEQEITLVVEDAIGCPDSITKSIMVFNINADFVSDTITCLPNTIEFDNLTESIAPITSYEWSFGSTEENPEQLFQPFDVVNDSLEIELIVNDEVGCVDTLLKKIAVYEIMAEIKIDNGPNICIDEEVNFSQSIIDETGSNVFFRWESNEFGTQEGGDFNIKFTESGIYNIDLVYGLENGDCENKITQTIEVIAQPIAEMTTSIDGEFPICSPRIIEFMNTSSISGPSTVNWVVNGESRSRNNNNPTFSFDKGLHTVELIVRSFYGCADTLTREFDLVEPEGTFDIDITDICFGDQFTVSLNSDTSDVFSYIWDMGDGTQIENQNPVTHTYNYNPGPDGNRSTIDLILRAADEACETIHSVPVNIFEVFADFTIDASIPNCGEAEIINSSIGNGNYEWYIDGELVSNETSPIINFPTEISQLDIQLILKDNQSDCVSDTIITLDVNNIDAEIKYPNIFSPNGDGENDIFKPVVNSLFTDQIEFTQFQIYNRWGNLIYDNSNDDGWDGTHNGEPVPSEVYAYFIEINIANCSIKTKKGNVTLVR